MSGCKSMQAKFTEYLDGRLNGRQMQEIAAHLTVCQSCTAEWHRLKQTQSMLAELGPVPVPEDLALKIRVALSHERVRRHQGAFHGVRTAWSNTVGPFIFQAAAGFCSATLLLGTVIVLVSMFAQPESAQANSDEPLGNATAPRLLYTSNNAGENPMDGINASVVVEAYVNGSGQVYDFKIVSGPNDQLTRSQVENLLLFSVFEPARFFGQPVKGMAVLNFAGVSVHG